MANSKGNSKRNHNDLRLVNVRHGCRGLDPRLQELMLRAKESQRIDHTIASVLGDGPVEVDVMARLHEPRKKVAGLKTYTLVKDIVTGTVKLDEVEKVRGHDNVASLKAATRILPGLHESIPNAKASPPFVTLSSGVLTGRGVVVGVVDFGFDFAHGNFRHAVDGTTRIHSLWNQRGGPSAGSPKPYAYGTHYSRSEINSALTSGDPYRSLGYAPYQRGAHGTHVLDIAAGNGNWTGAPGVAPDAELVLVELSAWDYGQADNFGNSRRLAEAVHFVFETAAQQQKSCVVNISLGTHGGPHDGSNLVEQYLDNLLEKHNDRAIAVAAGNSRLHASHASGRIAKQKSRKLEWIVQPNDDTENEIEIWYRGRGEASATLTSPTGAILGPVKLGTTWSITQGGKQLGRMIHREDDPNNGDHQINISLLPDAGRGTWQIEIHAIGKQAVDFHAWIERDDYRRGIQSFLGKNDIDQENTLGSIACGELTIAVASHQPRHPQQATSVFSAMGPTREGGEKPELSAPGDPITAASSLSGGATTMSGTSMASPHVAGIVALMMQGFDGQLSIGDIRGALIRSATSLQGWDPVFGHGRVNAAGALQELGLSVETHSTRFNVIVKNSRMMSSDYKALTNALRTLRSILGINSVDGSAEEWAQLISTGTWAPPTSSGTWPPPISSIGMPPRLVGGGTGTQPPPIASRVHEARQEIDPWLRPPRP
ncbi:MAG: S8 family serine peptidase [Planctomycetota bacterium]